VWYTYHRRTRRVLVNKKIAVYPFLLLCPQVPNSVRSVALDQNYPGARLERNLFGVKIHSFSDSVMVLVDLYEFML
jgi:hypothetical protein